MWLRLRQIALVAEELAPVEEELIDVLGIKVCYRDSGVARFGLENALIPIGNQLLEVVAPVQEKTTAERYLRRRSGNGGYMVITQCDDHQPRVARVKSLGIRMVSFYEGEEFNNMQLHPRDTGGSFLEIDEQVGSDAHNLDGPWEPAGKNWQEGRMLDRVSGISAAEIQCDDPKAIADRWSEIMELPVIDDQGTVTLVLDNARLRFVPCLDGRPEGLAAIDVLCTNRSEILRTAGARDAITTDNQIHLCGLRINLLDASSD